MKVLAIDTATEQCSVAVRVDGRTFEQRALTARGHAELLLPMVDKVMVEAGCTLANLDGLAFGRGPGAFTGVRIAVGAIQGISLGSGLPVVGVSTLAAVAQQFVVAGEAVLVCMDARMNEVYWGVYSRDASGVLSLVGKESVGLPGSVSLGDQHVVMGVGTGFRAYPALKEQFQGLRFDDTALPNAQAIASLGESALCRGEGLPASGAQPVYLRDQVAWVTAAPVK
ncbi:MAG: tRNA (adenosine(37)-N6)-threonylcarbamoyltransferase complex dimerization subunit type 1 TsaB [Steroidobacteraceae bacterium]